MQFTEVWVARLRLYISFSSLIIILVSQCIPFLEYFTYSHFKIRHSFNRYYFSRILFLSPFPLLKIMEHTKELYMWVIAANNTVFKWKLRALINILFGDNCKFTCKKQCKKICVPFLYLSLVVTTCKTIVQYYTQDMHINGQDIENFHQHKDPSLPFYGYTYLSSTAIPSLIPGNH